MQKAYNDMVGQNMIKMAIGETLCVHSVENGDLRSDKITYEYVTHHIPAGQTCDVEGVQKSQYGPKTAKVAEKINSLLASNPGLAKRLGAK